MDALPVVSAELSYFFSIAELLEQFIFNSYSCCLVATFQLTSDGNFFNVTGNLHNICTCKGRFIQY
jgi:hypothetical protein